VITYHYHLKVSLAGSTRIADGIYTSPKQILNDDDFDTVRTKAAKMLTQPQLDSPEIRPSQVIIDSLSYLGEKDTGPTLPPNLIERGYKAEYRGRGWDTGGREVSFVFWQCRPGGDPKIVAHHVPNANRDYYFWEIVND